MKTFGMVLLFAAFVVALFSQEINQTLHQKFDKTEIQAK